MAVISLLNSAALECSTIKEFQQTPCFAEIIYMWDITPGARVTVRPNLYRSPNSSSYSSVSQLEHRNRTQYAMTWTAMPLPQFLHSRQQLLGADQHPGRGFQLAHLQALAPISVLFYIGHFCLFYDNMTFQWWHKIAAY